jgi:hypothetical protein
MVTVNNATLTIKFQLQVLPPKKVFNLHEILLCTFCEMKDHAVTNHSGLLLELATVQNGTRLVKITTKFSQNYVRLKEKGKFFSHFQ